MLQRVQRNLTRRRRLLLGGVAVVLVAAFPSACIAHELAVEAWVEPEAPTVGDAVELVVRSQLTIDAGTTSPVGVPHIAIPAAAELGLGEGARAHSQVTQSLNTNQRSVLVQELRFRLRPEGAGTFELPPIEARLVVGSRELSAETEALTVSVAAQAVAPTQPAEPRDPVETSRRTALLWVLGGSLAVLAAFFVLVIKFFFRRPTPTHAFRPVRPGQADDGFTSSAMALILSDSPGELYELCLTRIRDQLPAPSGGRREALTLAEIKTVAGQRGLSSGNVQRLNTLLQSAEACLFAGRTPDRTAMEADILHAAAVLSELREGRPGRERTDGQ